MNHKIWFCLLVPFLVSCRTSSSSLEAYDDVYSTLKLPDGKRYVVCDDGTTEIRSSSEVLSDQVCIRENFRCNPSGNAFEIVGEDNEVVASSFYQGAGECNRAVQAIVSKRLCLRDSREHNRGVLFNYENQNREDFYFQSFEACVSAMEASRMGFVCTGSRGGAFRIYDFSRQSYVGHSIESAEDCKASTLYAKSDLLCSTDNQRWFTHHQRDNEWQVLGNAFGNVSDCLLGTGARLQPVESPIECSCEQLGQGQYKVHGTNLQTGTRTVLYDGTGPNPGDNREYIFTTCDSVKNILRVCQPTFFGRAETKQCKCSFQTANRSSWDLQLEVLDLEIDSSEITSAFGTYARRTNHDAANACISYLRGPVSECR